MLADPWMNESGGAAAFSEIKSRLAGYLQGPVNFEQIYHCAHELRFASPPTPGAADEFKPIMQPFLSNTAGLSKSALEALCGKIVEVIFGDVSRSCGDNPLGLEPLVRFVETLRSHYVTRIYTTNYDDFPLQAVPELYTGFASSPSGVRRFDLDRFWHRERWDGIFHLHGSVHMGYQHPLKGTSASSSGSTTAPRRLGTPRLRGALRVEWMAPRFSGPPSSPDWRNFRAYSSTRSHTSIL